MKKAIIINSEVMGKGDDKLGSSLMGNFLRKLWASNDKPDIIAFYNSGVKLLGEGSNVLDALSVLHDQGVELVACGTCIDFYDLNGKLKVGRRTDMVEIVSIMMEAEKVVTI
ncbi:MAG: DsrE/DsrF-like family protein [Firmicutes bacterium ADurb.Bin419]|nr:MAG: DsrE/DsrF-like family protein [Firmicutes bacterium ADurb.Bin419]